MLQGGLRAKFTVMAMLYISKQTALLASNLAITSQPAQLCVKTSRVCIWRMQCIVLQTVNQKLANSSLYHPQLLVFDTLRQALHQLTMALLHLAC